MPTSDEIKTSFRDDLTDWASIQTSEEGFEDAGTIDKIITDALLLHNDSYTLDTLPEREREPLLTLAWVKVCYIRAAKAARDASIQGGNGYGQNRDTPYQKNTSLAKDLMARYREICADLNIANSKSSVKVSTVKVRDTRLDALVPLLVASNLPSVRASLTDPEPDSDYLILAFPFEYFTDYANHYIYFLEGDTPIFQNWNYGSLTGVPYINETATRVGNYTNPQYTTVKLTGLDKTQILRFIVAVRSRGEQYTYSNEVSHSLE